MTIIKKRKILGRRPKVSVVLPVYNPAPYLEQALQSIYNQTFQDFEIIAVDDGSTDGSLSVLLRFKKRYGKMRVFRHMKNKGVSLTVKKAINNSRGDYICRMDADDIMPSDRIEKQIDHLRRNKKTVAVGGQVLLIDSKNNIIGKKPFPLTHKEIYSYIFRYTPVQEATMMIAKRRLPNNFEFYRDGMNTAEEVELMFKLLREGRVENLNSVMHLYRYHDSNYSFANIKETFLLTLVARIRAVYKYGYRPSPSAVLITFAQAMLVLLLPQALTLIIYRALREGGTQSLPSLVRYNKSSVKSLLIK